MMSYLLFAGLGSAIYIGLAYAESAFFGHRSSFTVSLFCQEVSPSSSRQPKNPLMR
jgi:hypothetical protein